MTFLLETPLISLFFLFGSLVLSCCSTAILRLGKFKAKEVLRSPQWLFFRPFLSKLFPKHEWENLYFSISLSKQILQLAYAIFGFFYLLSIKAPLRQTLFDIPTSHHWLPLLLSGGFLIGLSILLDYCVRMAASLWSKQMLRFSSPLASIYLFLLFPLIGPLLQLGRGVLRRIPLEEETAEMLTDKTKLREMIRESGLHQHLDSADQKLITSFVNFKERVVKEIMVPRVDLFALPADTPLREAARLFASEGYSRIPIYRETLDQISGVILYKDLLTCYTQGTFDLDTPLEAIAKPVLYAPETKRIALLLQEFRTKQIHMAIIVDEYGGTEGIVTIEDILEELVGEIEDEYDIEGEQFWQMPDGGWVVDAKMSIIDIESQLGIHIPPNPEYETIGGYVFHCAGTIPTKGWRLSHDNFDLEVLSSNERSLKKIKILARKPKSS
jgi:CBS domain containing-hemolysin-like protein